LSIIWVLFLEKFLARLSHNVQGIRRFCGCDRENRRFSATAKMWWSKMPQRRALARRLAFCGTRAARMGGAAYTVC